MAKTQTKYQFATFVMPVLNEEKYLERAVNSVLAQKLNIDFELIIALGKSLDKTNRIAAKLQKQFPEVIRLIKNPRNNTARGLNLAISKAKGDVVIRIDAHSELLAGYAQKGIAVLEQTGAANVGGRMVAVGTTNFQKAVAWAYGSRFGIGGGSFHVGGQAGSVDSVYLGIFDTQKLLFAGGFDEELIRGQDWELNLRFRKNNELVWFDPELEVLYFPRGNLFSLGRQFYKTGKFRARLTRDAVDAASPRYFIPPLLVFSSLFIFPIAIYFLSVLFVVVFAKIDSHARSSLFIVLPTMHYSWGLGFLIGILKKPKNKRSKS